MIAHISNVPGTFGCNASRADSSSAMGFKVQAFSRLLQKLFATNFSRSDRLCYGPGQWVRKLSRGTETKAAPR